MKINKIAIIVFLFCFMLSSMRCFAMDGLNEQTIKVCDASSEQCINIQNQLVDLYLSTLIFKKYVSYIEQGHTCLYATAASAIKEAFSDSDGCKDNKEKVFGLDLLCILIDKGYSECYEQAAGYACNAITEGHFLIREKSFNVFKVLLRQRYEGWNQKALLAASSLVTKDTPDGPIMGLELFIELVRNRYEGSYAYAIVAAKEAAASHFVDRCLKGLKLFCVLLSNDCSAAYNDAVFAAKDALTCHLSQVRDLGLKLKEIAEAHSSRKRDATSAFSQS